MDFARRVYNHNWKMDPILRSLLDCDIYKFLMWQVIFYDWADMPVVFRLNNRTKTVRLASCYSEHELREQLDHARTLRFTKSQMIWLAGNTFYGKKGIFKPEFLAFVEGYQLPEYDLRRLDDGQYDLTFKGRWVDITMWEIYALIIVNTMRNRAAMAKMSLFDLERLYVKGKATLFANLDALAEAGVQGISDFGTRRRHDFLWQLYAVEAAKAILGTGFVGTSNAHIAMMLDLEAIGTNAHETRSTLAAAATTDDELRDAPYAFDRAWQTMYEGNLLVMLPDTFGTTGYLKNAPEFLNDWKGIRIDSKDPFVAGEEAIAWWNSRGIDPMTRRIIPSDGLDVESIIALDRHFRGRVGIGYGWGTLLTNNFPDPIKPISLVCKVSEANGRSAVKLSDIKTKRMGDIMEIERYIRVFGEEGMVSGREQKV